MFELTPDEGTYQAEVIWEEKKYRFDLPKTIAQGVVVACGQPDGDYLPVNVSRSSQWKGDSIVIMLISRGRLLQAFELGPTGKGKEAFRFVSRGIPSGVSQVVVFDMKGMILAERSFFYDRKDQLTICSEGNQQEFAPFAPVQLNFTVKDTAGRGVESTFSLAVRDAATSPGNEKQENILTYLLLSSELKGYVHRPGYYFESDDRVHRRALDLLMLVQGWSRYDWQKMTGTETFRVDYPAEECISIDGRVLQYGLKQNPRAGVEVLMWMYSGGESYKGKALTDSLGRFVFAHDIWGQWNLSLQVTEKGKRKNSDIRLNRFFSPPARPLAYEELQVPEIRPLPQLTDSLQKMVYPKWEPSILPEEKPLQPQPKRSITEGSHMLDQAIVKRKKKASREDVGLKNASVVYHMEPLLDELKDRGNNRAVTICDFLEQNNPFYSGGRYKGREIAYVVNNNLTSPCSLCGKKIMVFPEDLTLITIDETYGTACGYMPLSKRCGEYVTIFLYTKQAEKSVRFRGIRNTKLEGYARVKEFYSPDYSKGVLPGEEDYRRTLYWNPSVCTDSLGRAEVRFYNNGMGRRVRISAETVTRQGQVGVYKDAEE